MLDEGLFALEGIARAHSSVIDSVALTLRFAIVTKLNHEPPPSPKGGHQPFFSLFLSSSTAWAAL